MISADPQAVIYCGPCLVFKLAIQKSSVDACCKGCSLAGRQIVAQDDDRSLWTAYLWLNYGSNEIVNSNPVTRNLNTLLNELDTNKENNNSFFLSF